MTHSTKDTKSNDITASEGIFQLLSLKNKIKMSNCITRHNKKGNKINCQKPLERAQFCCCIKLLLDFFCAKSYSTQDKRNVYPCLSEQNERGKLKNWNVFLLVVSKERKPNAASNNIPEK